MIPFWMVLVRAPSKQHLEVEPTLNLRKERGEGDREEGKGLAKSWKGGRFWLHRLPTLGKKALELKGGGARIECKAEKRVSRL